MPCIPWWYYCEHCDAYYGLAEDEPYALSNLLCQWQIEDHSQCPDCLKHPKGRSDGSNHGLGWAHKYNRYWCPVCRIELPAALSGYDKVLGHRLARALRIVSGR